MYCETVFLSQEGTSEDQQNEGSGLDEAKPQRTLPRSEVSVNHIAAIRKNVL